MIAGVNGRCASRRSASRLLPALALLLGACLADRERPDPLGPGGAPILTAVILAPTTGATVLTSHDILVRIEARDTRSQQLEGVGFVARSLTAGAPLVDSAAVRFTASGQRIHEFTFQVPDTFTTNTQVDVYAIAFGPAGTTAMSEPVHLVVVQCPNGTCP